MSRTKKVRRIEWVFPNGTQAFHGFPCVAGQWDVLQGEVAAQGFARERDVVSDGLAASYTDAQFNAAVRVWNAIADITDEEIETARAELAERGTANGIAIDPNAALEDLTPEQLGEIRRRLAEHNAKVRMAHAK